VKKRWKTVFAFSQQLIVSGFTKSISDGKTGVHQLVAAFYEKGLMSEGTMDCFLTDKLAWEFWPTIYMIEAMKKKIEERDAQ
tara:strand:+ start:882 stop:1127 length:246 start_codon:yes stop_codon:yes gene_type:complete